MMSRLQLSNARRSSQVTEVGSTIDVTQLIDRQRDGSIRGRRSRHVRSAATPRHVRDDRLLGHDDRLRPSGSHRPFLLAHCGWRSLFFVGGGVPLVLVAILRFTLPESPKYLCLRAERHAELGRLLR